MSNHSVESRYDDEFGAARRLIYRGAVPYGGP